MDTMSSRYRLLAAICLSAVILSVTMAVPHRLHAQQGTAETLFERGMSRYTSGKLVAARLDFDEFILNNAESPRITTAYMMLAKTLYYLDETDKAESTARILLNRYPNSSYSDWASYMVAACELRRGDVAEAFNRLVMLRESTDDPSMGERCLRAIKNAIQPRYDHDTFLKVLNSRNISPDIINAAGSYEPHEVHDTVRTDLFAQTVTDDGMLHVGLLVPLTGSNSLLGNRLYEGVRRALDSYKQSGAENVELIVEDTESDNIVAALKAESLAKRGVVAIIGPVYGESTVTSAIVAQNHGIPFIAPLAQNAGLTELGENIFQLNFNPIVQAEALADLALNEIHATTTAVIASQDKWGGLIADTYTRKMKSSGVDVVRTVFFPSNLSLFDPNPLMLSIREHAPETTALPESTVVIDHASGFADSLVIKLDLAAMGPTRLPPVSTIDCILISAVTSDAAQIAQYVQNFNIDTILLGDSGWTLDDITLEAGDVVDGSYVVSLGDGTDRSTSVPDVTTFVARKGYDALSVVLFCIDGGAKETGAIRNALLDIQHFEGLASEVTFDKRRRTNTAVQFNRIENGVLHSIRTR